MATLLNSLSLMQAATDTSSVSGQTGKGETGAVILLLILLGGFVLFSRLSEKHDRNRDKLNNIKEGKKK